MFGLFQKFDNELYEELMKKDEMGFFDFITEKEELFLKEKSKTIYKALKKKGWSVPYLMDCAANRAMLQMAEETGAEIIKL